ncbi:MAG: DNA helicase RecG, partial [Gemmatimonadaceae bacterium]|nr:DNA helicase RecG [Gloeobacterales cyanobacterium ES-bin-141]
MLDLLQRLHRALAVEVDRGFENTRGTRQYFAEFLSTTLSAVPSELASTDCRRWQDLGGRFGYYPDLDAGERQHLVAETRRFLHQVRRRLEEAASPKDRAIPPANAEVLSQSTAMLKGIGPKSAQQLEKLGLRTVENLLRYYPRAYLDYSNRTTIQGCQVGETVTLVAEVRKVNCFTSPRNRKLTIFELTIGDGSGQMKISRFFAGTR